MPIREGGTELTTCLTGVESVEGDLRQGALYVGHLQGRQTRQVLLRVLLGRQRQTWGVKSGINIVLISFVSLKKDECCPKHPINYNKSNLTPIVNLLVNS